MLLLSLLFSPLLLQPVAPVLVPNPVADDSLFGQAVCWSSDSLVVGAPNISAIDKHGAVYVFQADQAMTHYELVKPIPGEPLDPSWPAKLGAALACIDGAFVAGAPGELIAGSPNRGAVYTFVFDANSQSWAPHATPRLALATPTAADTFGLALAADGGRLTVGAPGNDSLEINAGLLSLYQFSPAMISGPVDSDVAIAETAALGSPLAMSGDTLVAVAPSAPGGPRIVVYSLGNGLLTETQSVTGGDLIAPECGGADLELGSLGRSVALRGDTLLLGAPGAGDAGAVFVLERSGGTFTCTGRIAPAEPKPGEQFGDALALGDGIAVVAATANSEVAPVAGAVYTFGNVDGKGWVQSPGVVRGQQTNEQFGCALALMVDRVAIASCGAPQVTVFQLKASLGETCDGDGDCADGVCADGVCCDDARCGDAECWQCDAPASLGTCQFAEGAACSGGDGCVVDECTMQDPGTTGDGSSSTGGPGTSGGTDEPLTTAGPGPGGSDGSGDSDGSQSTNSGSGGLFDPNDPLAGCVCRGDGNGSGGGLAALAGLLGLLSARRRPRQAQRP